MNTRSATSKRASRAPGSTAEQSRWFVPMVVRELWRRFRHDSRAMPSVVWRAWVSALSVGFVLTLVLTVALVFLGQWLQGRGLQAWDTQTLRWVAAGPLTFANAITWQAPGDLLFQPIFVIAFVAIAVWCSRPLVAASIAASYACCFAFIWTGWLLWNRSRPNIIAGGLAAPGLHSFPSGHGVLTVAIYGLVAYFWIQASRSWLERIIAIGLCIVWISLVATSRVVLGTHWPSDVLAGCAIGLVWLAAGIIALRRAERAAQVKQT